MQTQYIPQSSMSWLLVGMGVVAACAHPVPVTPAQHATAPSYDLNAFGGHNQDGRLVMPRASLTQLTTSSPIPFHPLDDGARLGSDLSGFFGQLGLFAMDEVLSSDIETTLDSWFTASESTITYRRRGQISTATVVWDGPAIIAPTAPMTSLGEAGFPVNLHTAAPGHTNRGALVHLPATQAIPLRKKGYEAGYSLHGPVADALGVVSIHTINGEPIHTDNALWDAVDGWFTADTTVFGTPEGEVTVNWVGAKATPPAVWTLPVDVDIEERTLRDGIRPTDRGATIHREQLRSLRSLNLNLSEYEQRQPEGMALHTLLGFRALMLLPIDLSTPVMSVNGTPVHWTEDDETLHIEDARRILLTEPSATLAFADGSTFVLDIEGPPIQLHPDWPETEYDDAPKPYRGIIHGDPTVIDRLVVRRYLAEPISCSTRAGNSVSCIGNDLWTAANLPINRITLVDGSPINGSSSVVGWALNLCTATEASITAGFREQRTVHLRIEGPPVPCP
jgi:hypothetical protein